jgi:multidrug efflux pump subunit AcrA (membrane-fusion protein)
MPADKPILTLVAAAMAATMGAGCQEKAAPPPPPPTEVYVAEVVQKDIPVYLDLVGQTLGYQDAEIRARVEGQLESMSFREGEFVQRGTLLYEIDSTVSRSRRRWRTPERIRRRPKPPSRKPTTMWRATRRSSPNRR